MFTIRPPRRAAIIRATAAWVTKTSPFRSMSMTVSQESASSVSRPCGMFVPALFTRMSILPHSRSMRSKHTRIDASLRTSSRSASERRPFARSATASGSASSPFRDVTATSAPASARASATARPIPRDPPVTSARIPSSPRAEAICACASIRAMATASVEVRIPSDAQDRAARAREVLTKKAQAFLPRLHREVEPTRIGLLETRQERWRELRQGGTLDFLPDSRPLRESEWTVARVPADLRTRKVEITGPTDRKMVINALNSGASVYMADFEDANTPTWRNLIEGQRNLIDAIDRTIEFRNPDGRVYKLNEKTATLVVRPRGWHLDEKHFVVEGRPIAGALFDYGFIFYHIAKRLRAKVTGPYFYLPKLESHREARLWNEIFKWSQDELHIPRGSIKATVLVEVLTLAFEMDEVLYELREHSGGLNAGRWDYMFSIIKKFAGRPEFILPDRAQVSMTVPFMRAYTELLVKTCHRRGAFALGGMAAFIPNRRDPAVTEAALAKVRDDKVREANDGFDGTWVAHPDLVETAMTEFDRVLGAKPNQLDRQRPEVTRHTKPLLDMKIPGATITEAGLRTNVSVGIQYIASWLRGTGAAAINNLMEDAATAEISRSQVWQWVHHGVPLAEGPTVTRELVKKIEQDELAKIRTSVGDDVFSSGRYEEAASLFDDVAMSDDFAEFLTLPGYERLD